jgi:hypothetical protein
VEKWSTQEDAKPAAQLWLLLLMLITKTRGGSGGVWVLSAVLFSAVYRSEQATRKRAPLHARASSQRTLPFFSYSLPERQTHNQTTKQDKRLFFPLVRDRLPITKVLCTL